VSVRSTSIVAIAAFVGVTLVATLGLGNSLGSHPCAGWTGYAPIGECVSTFWMPALFVGPALGLVAAAAVILPMRRLTRHRTA
jgi:hypothetical protein